MTAEMIMNDTAVLEAMLNAESADELMAAFEAAGISLENVTKEEAFEAFQQVKCGELDDDELDEVAGGFSWSSHGSFLTKFFGASASTASPVLSAVKNVFGFAYSANIHVHQGK